MTLLMGPVCPISQGRFEEQSFQIRQRFPTFFDPLPKIAPQRCVVTFLPQSRTNNNIFSQNCPIKKGKMTNCNFNSMVDIN